MFCSSVQAQRRCVDCNATADQLASHRVEAGLSGTMRDGGGSSASMYIELAWAHALISWDPLVVPCRAEVIVLDSPL